MEINNPPFEVKRIGGVYKYSDLEKQSLADRISELENGVNTANRAITNLFELLMKQNKEIKTLKNVLLVHARRIDKMEEYVPIMEDDTEEGYYEKEIRDKRDALKELEREL